MAGYVRTADGETLAFAIFANNYENSSSVINAACDAIVVRLASFPEVTVARVERIAHEDGGAGVATRTSSCRSGRTRPA